MKSTIHTEAGVANIEATTGCVWLNDSSMLPHEAVLLAGELERAAIKADRLAQEAAAQARLAA